MLHRNRIAAAVVAALAAATCRADASQDAPKTTEKPAKAYSDPRVLVVTPRAAPVPALRYRLLPLESQRTPGDAAPIYIRLGARATAEEKKRIGERSAEWADLPIDRLPVADARKFVDGWAGTLQQLEFGARRRSCDWNYTLSEQKEDVFEVLMPDAQDMRDWARLQAIKARLEIAEHRHDDALRTIETGIAFGRHVGDGPFAINALVGMACAQVMFACLEDLVAQPDAPNLYWSLTALPRPLVDLRKPLETEAVAPDWLFPELAEAARPHAEAEWAPLLERLFARMKALEEKIMITEATGAVHPVKAKLSDLAAFKARALPAARAYVKERRNADEGMPDSQAVLLYLAGKSREIYDDQFKYAYLPYPEALAATAGAQKRLESYKDGPLDLFAQLIPTVPSVVRAGARLDRTVAALRVIEALRLHAADHGALPRSFDQVTVVPVPLDPLTGKPFEYRREGEAAVLVGPETIPQVVLTYRISLRKP